MHIHVHIHQDPSLIQELIVMRTIIANLQSQVAVNNDLITQAIPLITGSTTADDVEIQAVIDSLTTKNAELKAALDAVNVPQQ